MVIVALILVRVTWRTLRSYRGTRFSMPRTYVYTGVYVLIGVAFSALSYTEGVPYILAVPEVVLAAAAGLGSYRYSDRRIEFWRPAEGQLYFRGGVIIYLIYLLALLVGLGIDVFLIGPAAFALGTAVSLTGSTLYATMGADLLLTFGVGLLIGRSARVAKRYGSITRGEEVVPEKLPGAK